MASSITVTDSEITVLELSVTNKDSAAFLLRVPEVDRVPVLQKAIEVGLFCLERGQNAGDVEFVKRQIEGLLGSVEQAVGKIPDQARDALLGKIGTDDGQVLAPVKAAVNDAKTATEQRIREVRDLLANDLDPSKSTTVLGQALSAIRDLLNPKMEDSVQAKITSAVNQVALPNGSLAETVKSTVASAIKPLQDDVNRLTQELHGAEMVEDALAQTTAKGATFEDEVAVTLQQWAKMSGNSVEQVGPDNQPGDFVVLVTEPWATSGPLRIVVEARDRQNAVGRQKIAQDLEPKFRERQAHTGIYVSKTQAGLAKEIGDWAEGQCNSGPWVACSRENLLTAVRFAIVQQRLKEMKQSQPEVDAGDIKAQVDGIRTCIRRIRTIKTKVTNIKDAAGDIENESESLRREIEGHLSEVEGALLKARKPPEGITAVVDGQSAQII
jgi:uncharacterized protein YjbJ (UPF0337 family)